MAAAQVAKKLKDKRQQRTIEGIFKKVRHSIIEDQMRSEIVKGSR